MTMSSGNRVMSKQIAWVEKIHTAPQKVWLNLPFMPILNSYFTNPETGVRIGIARAGNVIGGGDWATDRIVPDCMRAWSENEGVDIRSPHATRPWQHVLEPLSGYLALAANLRESPALHGEPYNFGPPETQNHSVGTLIDEMAKYWDHVKWNDVSTSKEHVHEAGLLQLELRQGPW